ncbi:MAG: hypothetical protein IT453_14505 [Planctomycetes bacterium]|jgi:hypothetical protein|nr:hypothetical protein [Planctomycetota bacterium]
MLRTIPFAFVLLAVGGTKLSTTYTAEQSVRVSVESEFSIETTSFEMTRDGEPVEGGFGGGGGSETSRKIVHVDKWVGVEDGHAKKVERTFEELENKSVMRFGENERESSIESPLAGVTLELTAGQDGEVEVKVKEGDTPAQEVALQHHQLGLALDALLPDGEKEAGAKWDLDKAAVRRALLADVTPALFPPPEQTEESGGGPGGRRGGRGGRGGSSGRVFDLADWSGKATYSGDEEHDGAQCAVIELEIEAEGELPEMPRGGRRGGDVYAPELLFPTVAPKFEVKLEGKLFYSLADKRPIGLELEGTVKIETDEDREGREGGTMHISSTQEGKFTQKVSITKAE